MSEEVLIKRGVGKMITEEELKRLQTEALLGRKLSDIAEERKAKRPTIMPVQEEE